MCDLRTVLTWMFYSIHTYHIISYIIRGKNDRMPMKWETMRLLSIKMGEGDGVVCLISCHFLCWFYMVWLFFLLHTISQWRYKCVVLLMLRFCTFNEYKYNTVDEVCGCQDFFLLAWICHHFIIQSLQDNVHTQAYFIFDLLACLIGKNVGKDLVKKARKKNHDKTNSTIKLAKQFEKRISKMFID